MKPTDIQTLSSWRKYTKGLCNGCWSACCTLPVEANGSDLVRLGLATQEEADWLAEGVHDDLTRRLLKRKIIQAYDHKTKMFILAQVSGRDCVFLDFETRRCTVYEKRPDTCRNFPNIGPRSGFCPYRAQ